MRQGPLSVEELATAARRFKRAIVERAPGGELTHHLGYPPGGTTPDDLTVVAPWRRAWRQVIPFFAFPPEVRRLIDTTNALESVHARVRKIIKTRGHFPTDEAATKPIWLALRNITARWGGKAANYWTLAMQPLAIFYADRFAGAVP